ncbi:MAG: LamG domain-containing protein [Candidatus Aenigmarchaeota archaeon]|nr:LamG domain-containing protein [Candidatus Aenigmarchaeota archaeon]
MGAKKYFSGRRTSRLAAIGFGMALLLNGKPMAQDARTYTDSLIGYWKFEGNPLDSSDKGNNGQEIGNPKYVLGKIGQAISLDGKDDYVRVFSSDSLETWHAARQLTIEGWVYPTRFERDMFVFGKQGGECQDEFSVEILSSGEVAAQIVDDCASPSQIVSTTKLKPNEWTHIAFVYDKTVVRLYINGDLEVAETGVGAPVNHRESLDIGHVGGDPGHEYIFSGMIDETRFWNTALTQDEIKANMNRELTGK